MRHIFMILLPMLLIGLIGCATQQPAVTPEPQPPGPADEVPQEQERFCDDSDNGVTYFIAGEVIDAEGKYIDACLSDELLREYYCYDDQVEYDDYECLYGCADGVCRSDVTPEEVAQEEEEVEVEPEQPEDELVFCGSRQSVPCPEGLACFDHPSAQREWGVCQEYEMYPEDSEFAGWIKCPDVSIDVEECPKGLERVCSLYFDSVKQRNTYKRFDSPCLACADTGTIGYKFGNC